MRVKFNQKTDLSKADVSRERILDAAAKLFRGNGYAATTLRDIADEARMKAGSIYYHFKSKEELLEAVLEIGIRSVHEAVKAAVNAVPPKVGFPEKIATAIEAHLKGLFKHGDYTSANIRIFGQIPATVHRRHLPMREAYGRYWLDLLKAGQASGELRKDIDPAMAAMMLIGAMNWALEWYKPNTQPLERIAHTFAQVLNHGVVKPKNRS